MSGLSDFIGVYPVSKTLRFELRPIGKTREWIKKNGVIEADEKIAMDAPIAKELIDKYHKICIKESLERADYKWEELKNALIADKAKKKTETKLLLKELREEIVKALTSHPYYDKFKLSTPAELFKSDLPDFIDNPVIETFDGFASYFEGFNSNRKNLYTSKAQTTGIAYRLVNENFSIFVANLEVYETLKANCPHVIDQTSEELQPYLEGRTLDMVFSSDCSFYNLLLTQEGIDFYNRIIGGVSTENKQKHRGINEFVNEFLQQQHNKEMKKKTITMETLKKQILSDRETLSYVPPTIDDDKHLVTIIDDFFSHIATSAANGKHTINILEYIKQLDKFNGEGIFIATKHLEDVSRLVYDDWSYIPEKLGIDTDYGKKNTRKGQKQKKSYSLEEIGITGKDLLSSYFRKAKKDDNKSTQESSDTKNYKGIDELQKEVLTCWKKFENIKDKSHFKNNQKGTEIVKNLIDSVLAVLHQTSIFCVDEAKDCNVDMNFYYTFNLLNKEIRGIIPLHDRVHNYLTGKPQITKLKLNFETPKLACGFSLRKNNNEPQYNVVLLFRNGLSYLGVLNSKNKPKLANLEDATGDSYKRLIIQYDGNNQNNKEKKTNKMIFTNIAVEQVDEWVKKGQLYLFQIYNKDYAEGAKGKKNLHTLYWENLFFAEENLSNPTIEINGMASLFYRRPHIKKKDIVKHKAGSKMLNRHTKEGKPIPDAIHHKLCQYYNSENPNVIKLTEEEKAYLHQVVVIDSKYDIIKDRRYTQEKFLFHIPIEFNANTDGNGLINENVKNFIKGNPNVNIIGIDRGERHLIYLTLINQKGEILKQKTFNTVNQFNYHEKLTQREEERDEARKSWASIGKIKDLKEGFLSAVVHEIAVIMVENNAIIVLEDLNFGFKRGRFKVERQVYQKFEKMLIDKLNYLCFKDRKADEEGGILKGYQLTQKFESFSKLGKQIGFLFYIPAAYTSKIDPVTGFANLFKFKQKPTSEEKKEFLEKMKRIEMKDGHIEFEFDYRDFEKSHFQSKWIVSTRGERIDHKNKTKRKPTEEIRKAIEQGGNIALAEGTDIKAILSNLADNSIYQKVYDAFRLTVQMRNSNPKTEEDYIISPVADKNGKYFCTKDEANKGKDADGNWLAKLPVDADANGAYHIALKGLYMLLQIKKQEKTTESIENMTISNWFKFMVEKPFLK